MNTYDVALTESWYSNNLPNYHEKELLKKIL